MNEETLNYSSKYTRNDMNRLNGYVFILNACKVKEMNICQIAREMRIVSDKTVQNYCKDLIDEGYLTRRLVSLKQFRRASYFYKAIKDNYTLNDLIPASVKRNNKMKRNGTNCANKKPIVQENECEQNNNPHITIYKMDSKKRKDLAELQHVQSKLNRKNYKPKGNYIRGSSLGMAV